jgi:toxin CcdB
VAQWDVYANTSLRTRADFPYLVDVQSNLLSGLGTRFVIPLAADATAVSSSPRRLGPVFEIKGVRVLAVPFEAGPVDSSALRRPVASLREQAHLLIDALDAVISGV